MFNNIKILRATNSQLLWLQRCSSCLPPKNSDLGDLQKKWKIKNYKTSIVLSKWQNMAPGIICWPFLAWRFVKTWLVKNLPFVICNHQITICYFHGKNISFSKNCKIMFRRILTPVLWESSPSSRRHGRLRTLPIARCPTWNSCPEEIENLFIPQKLI